MAVSFNCNNPNVCPLGMCDPIPDLFVCIILNWLFEFQHSESGYANSVLPTNTKQAVQIRLYRIPHVSVLFEKSH